ncbi:MAG: hypothetical protein ABSA18_03520 [Dehalococcoidia bacterium]
MGWGKIDMIPDKQAKYYDFLPVPMWDQMQYLIRKVSDQQIRAVIKFDGRLDPEILKRAVMLSLDIEPVLRCRFVERDPHPRWERLAKLEINDIYKIVTTSEVEKCMADFLAEEIDPLMGPQLKVLLIRSDADRLCINMNHAAGDAGGMKDYMYLLAFLYRELALNGNYQPRSNAGGVRGLDQVFRHLTLAQKMRVLWKSFTRTQPVRDWCLPLPQPQSPDRFFTFLRLPPDRFEKIKSAGEKLGATVNDVVLAACYRVLYKMINPGPEVSMRMFVTVDMRRYIPSGKADAICNLASSVFPDIGSEIGQNLEETVSKVTSRMSRLKDDLPGLSIFLYTFIPFKLLPFSIVKRKVHEMMRPGDNGRSFPPGFTNMGIIDAERLVFPGVNVVDAFITGAVNYPPAFQLGFTSFNSSLTFSVCSCGKAENGPVASAFLDLLNAQLPL